MANEVKELWVDTSQKRLVKSEKSAAAANQPIFVQGDTVTLRIVLLSPNPSGGFNNPWTRVDVTGMSVRVGIGTPSAATGSATPGIFQNSFTLDEENESISVELHITASAVATLLGSAVSGEHTLEIEIAEGGNYSTVYSGPCILRAELIEAAAAPPGTPSDTYMTKNESLAAFVRKIGNPGETITLKSPDGTKEVILYVDNDGIFHWDLI